jgi:manganese efflux pump family protein
MGLAALIAWLLTAGIGAYMLRTWVVRGGLRRQRATGAGVPPAVVFGHAGAALSGLVVWIAYLSSGWRPLAWLGVILVCAAICLGIGTVTVWTPYPVRPAPAPEASVRTAPPAPPPVIHDEFTVTDEMIASLLAEPVPARPRRRPHLLPLIPLLHGFGALTTFLLAVTAALLPVR